MSSQMGAAAGQSHALSQLKRSRTGRLSIEANIRRDSLREEFNNNKDNDRFARGVTRIKGESDQQLFDRIFVASEYGTKILQPENRPQEEVQESQKRYHATVTNYRRQLHAMQRRTLNPQGKLIARWDVLISTALTFTAIYLPYEIGFLPSAFRAETFTINRLLDMIFLIDTGVAFFTPYRDKTENILGTWVYDNKKIAKNYLKGWFTIDMLSLIPYDLILFAVEDGDGKGSAGSSLRVLRVLRIMKLARMLRASRILDRWENHWGVSYAKTALIKFLLYAMMTAHWLACCWGFAGKISQIDGTQLRQVGGFGQSWIERAGLQDASAFELYAVSLYIAFNNVFGSTPEINPACVTEFFVQCFMLVCGSAVWAFIIGSSCGIIATLDPSAVEYRHTMDELNYFMNDKKFTQEHKVRLRSFFSQTLHRIRSERYETLLGRMSLRLRGETSLTVARSTLRRVNYLADPDVEGDFLSKIALVMRLDVFARHERISCTKLTIIERGITSKRGKIAMMGSCYGQDMILSNPALRDTAAAIALTFVQVLILTKPDLDVLIQDYPKAQRVLRKNVVVLAFKRAVVRLATLRRNMEEHSPQSLQAYHSLGGLDALVAKLLKGKAPPPVGLAEAHLMAEPSEAPMLRSPAKQRNEPKQEQGASSDEAIGVARLRNLERRIDAHQRQVNKRMDDLGDLILALNRKTDRVDWNVARIAALLGDESIVANGAGGDRLIAADSDSSCTNFRNFRQTKSGTDGLREPMKRSLTFATNTALLPSGGVAEAPAPQAQDQTSNSLNRRSSERLPWTRTTSVPSANSDENGAPDNLLSGRLEA